MSLIRRLFVVVALCVASFGCESSERSAARVALSCDTHADCPPSEECEFEHGGSYCRPHGTEDGPERDGGAPSGSSCRTDADCAPGFECEDEHGESWCKPHGGDRRDDGI